MVNYYRREILSNAFLYGDGLALRLRRSLQIRRQVENQAKRNIDLAINGHEKLLDDGKSVVGGVDLSGPGHDQLRAFAPAGHLRLQWLGDCVEDEISRDDKFGRVVLGRGRGVPIHGNHPSQLETDSGIRLDMQPLEHVLVATRFEGRHFGRRNIDLGADDKLRFLGIDLGAAAEFLRLAVEVVQERVPGEFQRALLRIERDLHSANQTGKEEGEDQPKGESNDFLRLIGHGSQKYGADSFLRQA